MANGHHNLRPADPQGLERRREEVDRREQEVALERRQDEREQRQAAATREVAALRAEVDSLRAELNALYTELVHALSAVVGDLGEIISRGLNQTLDNIETENAKMRKEIFDVFDRRFSELRAELAALPTARGGAFRVASDRADEVSELPNPLPPRRTIN